MPLRLCGGRDDFQIYERSDQRNYVQVQNYLIDVEYTEPLLENYNYGISKERSYRRQ